MSTLGPCPAWQQLVGVGSSRKEPLNMIDAKGKEIDAHTGRMPNEDEGRDVVMHVSVKECQRLLAKHQKLR